MPLNKKLIPFCDRAVRALGDSQVSQALKKYRAIIGPEKIPNSEPQAQAAYDLLRDGNDPTPEQIISLAIVIRLMRPVVFSREGQLDDLPDSRGRNLYPDDLW